MQLFVDRTPGSLLEEKEFSLVWHYRKADPELAQQRQTELKENILHLIVNSNLALLEGSKVLEVKNSEITKGFGAKRMLEKEDWEFILAIGDDVTDEDTFTALPDSAYTIKVGAAPSKARFFVKSITEVRKLLKNFQP